MASTLERMTKMPTIRRATTSDIPALITLLHQICTLHHNARPDMFKANSKKYDETQLAAILADETRATFVANNESGSVLGYCFCKIEHVTHPVLNDHTTLYIDDFCVDEACHRQGVGKMLFASVHEYAKQINANYIELNVWECNENAIKFYESCGFTTRSRKMEMVLNISTILELQYADLHLAAEVIRASFATVAAQFCLTAKNCPTHPSLTTPEKLQSYFTTGALMFGLYENKQLIGYVALSNENETFTLHNLAILPEHRNKGYGKQMVDFCKTKAKEMGGNKIKIAIIDEHIVLKNWYATNGFVCTATKNFTHLPFMVGYMEVTL